MFAAEHAELRSLRLEHILAAADLDTLQQHLTKRDPNRAPFLLQPLMGAPHLVEGEPNSRLLLLAQLLTEGAKLNGSAKAAAIAASTIQQMMMVSVCRGFTSAEGQLHFPSNKSQIESMPFLSADIPCTVCLCLFCYNFMPCLSAGCHIGCIIR